MFQQLTVSMKFFQLFLSEQFLKHRYEGMEALLMLVVGNLMGFYNPNQLADYLGLDKNALYRELRSWSLYQFKRMLTLASCHCALEPIRQTLEKSASTQSRNRITISVDDTVLKRCGACLSYIYSWWSGQYNRVIDGQNLLAVTIRIGARVFPLSIRPVGKQGRANTTKPELLKVMLTEIMAFFTEAGVDLTQFPITFDSWYGSQPLSDVLGEMGFSVQLVDSKSNYIFTIDQYKQPLSHHKREIDLQVAWGCDVKVARKVAQSPTFGKVVLLFFADGKRTRCMMCLGKALRGCEILSIWRQHHGIEQFWRSLKSLLKLSSMSLHGRDGAYSGIAVKVLSYLLGLLLSEETGLTLHQIQMALRREVSAEIFFFEHFHPSWWLNPLPAVA